MLTLTSSFRINVSICLLSFARAVLVRLQLASLVVTDTSVYWAKIKEKMTKLGTKSVYNILVVPVNHNRESSTTMSDII